MGMTPACLSTMAKVGFPRGEGTCPAASALTPAPLPSSCTPASLHSGIQLRGTASCVWVQRGWASSTLQAGPLSVPVSHLCLSSQTSCSANQQSQKVKGLTWASKHTHLSYLLATSSQSRSHDERPSLGQGHCLAPVRRATES